MILVSLYFFEASSYIPGSIEQHHLSEETNKTSTYSPREIIILQPPQTRTGETLCGVLFLGNIYQLCCR